VLEDEHGEAERAAHRQEVQEDRFDGNEQGAECDDSMIAVMPRTRPTVPEIVS